MVSSNSEKDSRYEFYKVVILSLGLVVRYSFSVGEINNRQKWEGKYELMGHISAAWKAG